MRTRSGLMTSALLVICTLMCSCERVSNWFTGKADISSTMASLETADHLVIRNDFLGVVSKETAQPDDIAAVRSLTRKYPTGWKAIPGGSGGDYNIYFYRG